MHTSQFHKTVTLGSHMSIFRSGMSRRFLSSVGLPLLLYADPRVSCFSCPCRAEGRVWGVFAASGRHTAAWDRAAEELLSAADGGDAGALHSRDPPAAEQSPGAPRSRRGVQVTVFIRCNITNQRQLHSWPNAWIHESHQGYMYISAF